MKESRGNDNKDACNPNCAGEPKSNGGQRVEPGSIVGGTTKGLGDDLPGKYDKSENIASGDPEVGLVGRRQLPEVRKAKFGLYTNQVSNRTRIRKMERTGATRLLKG